MLQPESPFFQDFLSGVQAVEELTIKHLFPQLNCEKISINTSPLFSQPLVSQLDHYNAYHLYISHLSNCLCKNRNKKKKFSDEIVRVKEQIIDKFNKLCNDYIDEKMVESIREQRQKIVELLLEKTQIENKQKTGELCKGIMNGSQPEILNQFYYYVHQILWTSYATPLPQGVVELIKQGFNNETSRAIKEKNLLTCHYLSQNLLNVISKYDKSTLKRKKFYNYQRC